jgi:hypothetical protein
MGIKVFSAVCSALLITAPVQSACWSNGHVQDARLRDLQTYLMVETLRCQMIGFDLTPEYNRFLRSNRSVIGRTNDHLKAYFISASGPVFGQQAYDRFTTTLANAYGASRTNSDTCDNARSAASEAALMDNDSEGLLMIAERQGLSPNLPGGQCNQASLAEARR